ncbi:hypothetical protein, partial [Tistrella bauzanensis]|uniref:hypothetical protein n=1 Tax=Tistrella bauzanensis TaxID=657419 RepID=UPI001E40ECEA
MGFRAADHQTTTTGCDHPVAKRGLVPGRKRDLGQRLAGQQTVGDDIDGGQGNRVKILSCDDACEEVVVPSGDLASE